MKCAYAGYCYASITEAAAAWASQPSIDVVAYGSSLSLVAPVITWITTYDTGGPSTCQITTFSWSRWVFNGSQTTNGPISGPTLPTCTKEGPLYQSGTAYDPIADTSLLFGIMFLALAAIWAIRTVIKQFGKDIL